MSEKDISLLRAYHFIAVKTAGWPEQGITKQEICSGICSEVHKTNELSKEGHHPPVINSNNKFIINLQRSH